MRVDDFDFDLPAEQIALRPAEPREAARLLVIGCQLADYHIGDLPALLRPGDVMVLNDTRVIPAQLSAKRGEASVGLTLHRRLGRGCWQAFARPARRLNAGDRIDIAGNFGATVLQRVGAFVDLDFGRDDAELGTLLERHGEMPLPPYIRSRRAVDNSDRHDYQTLYAENDGAVAAPTAGLHFTEKLMSELAANGVGQERVTLHVGAGTFLPVTADDTDDHTMLSEIGLVDAQVAERLNRARAEGRRIIAVGSTSMRLLESAAGENGVIHPYSGETALFITPGYKFKVIDQLLTNFHLPRSTLFMLVAAFAGLETIRRAYRHAIETGYRFYSYGDACLISRQR